MAEEAVASFAMRRDGDTVTLLWPPRRAAAEPAEAEAALPEPAVEEPPLEAPDAVPAAGETAPPVIETAAPAEPISEAQPSQDTVAGAASLAPEPELAGVEEPEQPEQTEQTEQAKPPEWAAAYDAIPDTVPDPLRGMLVREQQVLSQLEQTFGPQDPGVLNTRSNLAYYLISAGEYRRAVQLQETVAAETARILGDKHPHTLTARSRLAQWRKLAKKHRRPKASVPA